MKRLILLISILSLFNAVYGDILESFRRLKDDGYNYWLYQPDSLFVDADSAFAKKPLIIFLHGQSLCGRDMNKVLRYGTIDAIKRGRKIDAYVITPQNPGGRWDPAKVFDIVDWTAERYAVDTTRIYVLGMSLGGFGTINVTSAYPDRIAAAMALCGGGNNPDFEALNKVPLWILHGTADRAIKIRDSEDVVKGMKAAGNPERMEFTRLKGLNHSILARVFYMPQTYDWLFSHSLQDSARTMNRDYTITVSDFSKAYNDLSSPQSSKLTTIRHHNVKDGKVVAEESDDADAKYHVIKSGDTLSAIARRYHTSVKNLCRLNNIKETTILRIGKKLRVH